MILLVLALACTTDRPAPGAEPDVAGCPPQMARVAGVDGDFCIHRFEVRVSGDLGDKDQGATWPKLSAHPTSLSAAAGERSTKGLSWYQAAAACQAMRWQLCTSQQWEDACDGTPGPGGRTHPTADGSLDADTCNINHPGSQSHADNGSSPHCRTPEGVYDLEGNLWEWTDPGQQGQDGLPLIDKRGGGHYSGDIAECDQAAVGSHAPSFDGTIGFRCCTPAS